MRRIWTAKASIAVRFFISSDAGDRVEAADLDPPLNEISFERSSSGVPAELGFLRTGLDVEHFVESHMASSRS